MQDDNALSHPQTEGFGGQNVSPKVCLSLLSCGCHSGVSPAFFTHDTAVSAGCQQEKSSDATTKVKKVFF